MLLCLPRGAWSVEICSDPMFECSRAPFGPVFRLHSKPLSPLSSANGVSLFALPAAGKSEELPSRTARYLHRLCQVGALAGFLGNHRRLFDALTQGSPSV